MKVKNRRCIRNLSIQKLKVSKTRNLIAVSAIALTTLLFTALFTVELSILSSFEEYTFRQIGGYAHGTFKEVSGEQIRKLSAHRKVKEYGLRTLCGTVTGGPFAKAAAEVGWMDGNNAKWSYATPSTGRMPESGREIAMDSDALEKLGVTPRLGERVELTYQIDTGRSDAPERTDAFTLVGFWEYDDLMPVHYIHVSRDYVGQVQADNLAAGGFTFRTDMNVMLASSVNIQGVLESIDRDCGYQWEDREAEDCVRIGTNWGYTASGIASQMDAGTAAAIAVFLILVIFTGYLIIYNIFQISVSNDIRHYGLLKTIGTTPRQLRRIVRLQALYLSMIGIPLGCLLGYGVGCTLVSSIMTSTTVDLSRISASPAIFLGAAAFALLTVLLSCAKPAKKAGRVTPVEALRYTEGQRQKKKHRNTRGAGIGQMAFANLSRSKTKTLLAVLSMSLAVALLNSVAIFINGFDTETYLSHVAASDFLVGTEEYFQYRGHRGDAGLSGEQLQKIQENTRESSRGCVYALDGQFPICWLDEEAYRDINFLSGERLEWEIAHAERRDGKLGGILMAEGFDEALLDKLIVYDGDLAPLTDAKIRSIAVAANADDDGEISSPFRVGDTLTATYVEKGEYFDVRTGEPADETTTEEFVDYRITASHDVEYRICAIVGIPRSMSFRAYTSDGVGAVLDSRILLEDSKGAAHPMLYVFDALDADAEAAAEEFLSGLTNGGSSGLQYESKAILSKEFDGFRSMFLMVGGVLCFIVGLVGALNFFNAILTGILTRRHEFAMLQAVGMTGRQLRRMLVLEGVFYAAASGILSLFLSLGINAVASSGALENVFWFFSYHFTILPVLVITPVFLALGALIPLAVYRSAVNKPIVERLKETED